MVMMGCQENKSCSKVLNLLERLDDRIRCTHKETVAVVSLWVHLYGYTFMSPYGYTLMGTPSLLSCKTMSSPESNHQNPFIIM